MRTGERSRVAVETLGLDVSVAADDGVRRPGPRRPEGSPSGPEQVRRALLDAAASLFAERGVDRVSLRDVSAAADVHLALIQRYIGSRDELVHAVFEDLSGQLAGEVLAHPLEMQGFDVDTVMGKWVRVMTTAQPDLQSSGADASKTALVHVERSISNDHPWASRHHVGQVLRDRFERTRDAKVQNYRLLRAERETRAQLRHERNRLQRPPEGQAER